MTAKAYSYLRYSSPAQARGDSARRQLKGAGEWAERHGLDLDTSLRDLGVSGFTGVNRIKGALGSFLQRVENGEVARGSYLLVDSMDRLSRETEGEVLHLLTGLTRQGIKVVNVSEDHVLDDKADFVDFMRVLIHAARSHQESKEKGRKVAEAHRRSKSKARDEGRVWHQKGPTWLRREGDGWAAIPEKVAVVQKAFDLREAGMGTTAIAIRFNEDGVPTPTGKEGAIWGHSAVLELLRNRAVLGEYQPRLVPHGQRGSRRPADGDPIPGYYVPVIAEDQFHRVGALIAASHSAKGRRPNTVQVSNLFSGVTRCRECGGVYGVHGGAKLALRCTKAAVGMCENKRRYRYDAVEAAILANVRDFDLTPPARQDDSGRVALGAAVGRVAELEGQIRVLLDRIETGGADELVEARYTQRRADWTAAKAQVADLQRRVTHERVKPTPGLRMQQVEALKAAMAGKEGRELYDVRIRLSQAIRDVVTGITFTADGSFFVEVLDGFSMYIFRDFAMVFEGVGSASLIDSPKYAKRFGLDDPAREAKARRVVRNLGA